MIFSRFASAIAAVTFATTAVLVGCSNDAPPNPRILLDSTVGPGNNGAAVCGLSSEPWIQINNSGASVDNGGTATGGSGVAVTCSVTSNGDGTFNVSASATISGTHGGSFTIVGKFAPAPGPVTGVQGTFTRADTGAYKDLNCTVTYGPNMGVAAGRVWGMIDCPKITRSDTSPPAVCDGQATFKFENCSQ